MSVKNCHCDKKEKYFAIMINIGLLFSTTTGLTKVQKAKNLKNEPIISAET